jgi:hypothetical protein
MIKSFFKKINLFNWQGVEEEPRDDDDQNQFEYSIARIFFIKPRTIKLYNSVFFNIYNYNNIIYTLFLKFRYNFFSNLTFLLGHFEKNKFQWTNFNYMPYKMFTRVKPVFFIQPVITNLKKSSTLDKLKTIVVFKKKNGFLKKKSKIKNFLLLKLNNLKNSKFLHSFSKNKNIQHPDTFGFNRVFFSNEKRHSDVSKFLDLKKRWKKLFNSNRNLLKSFKNINKSKQFQLTKEFSKFLKKKLSHNFIQTEFSLLNLLIRSKLVFTTTEALFFLKNGFIYLNGVCTTNPYQVAKLNDIINFIFGKKYFYFFKTNFNQKLKLTYAVGYRLWRLNRFRNNFYKQSPTGIPEWVLKLSFFYEDVPSFIEVDYTILTLTLIKYPTKFYNYNFFFTKFISMYLLRLYNWKYVI